MEKLGYEVIVPALPNTAKPVLKDWLKALNETVGEPDTDTYLVGHSIGSVLILRYLESLKMGQKIGGAVMVAGFTDDLGFKEIANFFETSFDFDEIKKHCANFVAIHSDNDPYVALKYGDEFKSKIDAKLIIKHNAKHFSGAIENEDSCKELPEVVESLKLF